MADTVLWEAMDIVKSFGPTLALAGASLQLRPGEIHALVGENGAGKSTMSKVACGVYPADSGRFRFGGEEFSPLSLTSAAARGVGLVFQESTVSTTLTVAENIFLERLREFRRAGFVDRARLRREAAAQLTAVGADFDVDTDWAGLNLGQRKMVELARVLSRGPRLLFVDEATAVLDAAGRELVLSALRRLRDQGLSVCYVSHHMAEIFSLTDRITVMRDGRAMATLETAAATRPQLESLMVGREVAGTMFPQRQPHHEAPTALTVNAVGHGDRLQDVSFELRSGEVLGIAGLAGCGGAELLKVIAGELPALQGGMTLTDAPYAPRSPRDALRQGVAYLPGDRDEEGLLGSVSVRENIALSTLPSSLRAVRPALERQTAAGFVASLGIKTPSVEAPVEGLSGGNRQKVVLAKLLATSPRLLLLDNPTRGVDVGARAQIYQAVARAAADGMSVVLLSEDLPELLGVADRLLVLRSGRPSNTFPDATVLTEQDVLPHML